MEKRFLRYFCEAMAEKNNRSVSLWYSVVDKKRLGFFRQIKTKNGEVMYKHGKIILCAMFLFCLPVFTANAQTVKLEYKTSKVERLERHHIEGETPRVMLLVSTGDYGDSPWLCTPYFILDFSDIDSGFKQIYTVPTRKSRLEPLSPCFGGVGIFEEWRDFKFETILFDTITGTKGPVLSHNGSGEEWLYKNELRFISSVSGDRKDIFRNSICRYDFERGVFLEYSLKMSKPKRVDGNSLLAVMNLDEKEQLVLIDIDKSEATILTALPEGVKAEDIYEIHPAGSQCKDGAYFTTNNSHPAGSHIIKDHSLWWKSPHAECKSVASNVPIWKLEGGLAPWLPAAYVGEGRFAIARTVGVREFERTARAKTILIDGTSGKVLEKTGEVVYGWMPPLNIPPGWWKAGEKPEEENRRKIGKYFHWDEKYDNILDKDNKIVLKDYTPHLQSKAVSADGRYLIIYDVWSKPCNSGECLNFRIVDGVTGKEKTAAISAEIKIINGCVKSFFLCPENFNPEDFNAYMEAQ